jgi:DNA-binding IclR family transcriptional regulator
MGDTLPPGGQTLDRALSVLQEVARSGGRGVTLAKCSSTLGFSKASTHRILHVLVRRGFLRFDDERGIYLLGLTNLRLGMQFLVDLDLRREALPVLRDLAAKTGETVHLGVLDGHSVVYIEKVESPQAVRMYSMIGRTMPAYCTGVGKAILAWLEPAALDRALPDQLEARTANTITDRAALKRHLQVVRERGYSTDDIENEQGIRCVGAPVFDHAGDVCASISVAGPHTRVTPIRFVELGELVRDAAMRISVKVGHRLADEPGADLARVLSGG